MKRAWVLAAFCISFPETAHLEAQGPGFTFEFASASPAQFSGMAGEPFGPFEVLVGIRPRDIEGDEGPQGWSMAVTHEPGEPYLELLQVTIDGTNAGDLLDQETGFVLAEIVDPEKNGGRRGFVTSAVLSDGGRVSLPPDRFSSVISATYRGTHPEVMSTTETELEFRFADGLTGSEGQGTNEVSFKGVSYAPDFLPLERKLKTSPACNSALTLAMDAPGIAGDGEDRKLRVDLPAGQDLVVEATARLSSTFTGLDGAEAWSISVQHDPLFLKLLAATTDGTDADILSDPSNRILKTRVIQGEDVSGFISAAILSTVSLKTLPPLGDFTIARARYRLVAPHDAEGTVLTTAVRFKDGLKELSLPVENIITVGGKSERACWKWPLRLEVNVIKGGKVFRRGDSSNDARINLTDVIAQVRWIFGGAFPPVCQAALDANGDLAIDISDVVYLLDFLFRGGDPIPPPRCTPDPRLDDPLPCDEERVRCP